MPAPIICPVPSHAVIVTVADRAGTLSGLTAALAARRADINYIDIIRHGAATTHVYLEFAADAALDEVAADLKRVDGVSAVESTPSLAGIYGKRIVIMGGGAQVGQVAVGAISEADRHNIRGERISVDTIPLVGEQQLADAVRAVARLPRAFAIVLAGSLMGGEIEKAVREVRALGLLVVSLNMAGSVPDAADLVVTDPVQAGVMTVMAIADTAKFTIERLQRRVF